MTVLDVRLVIFFHFKISAVVIDNNVVSVVPFKQVCGYHLPRSLRNTLLLGGVASLLADVARFYQRLYLFTHPWPEQYISRLLLRLFNFHKNKCPV